MWSNFFFFWEFRIISLRSLKDELSVNDGWLGVTLFFRQSGKVKPPSGTHTERRGGHVERWREKAELNYWQWPVYITPVLSYWSVGSYTSLLQSVKELQKEEDKVIWWKWGNSIILSRRKKLQGKWLKLDNGAWSNPWLDAVHIVGGVHLTNR